MNMSKEFAPIGRARAASPMRRMRHSSRSFLFTALLAAIALPCHAGLPPAVYIVYGTANGAPPPFSLLRLVSRDCVVFTLA